MLDHLTIALCLVGLYTVTCNECYCTIADSVSVHIAVLGVPIDVGVIYKDVCFYGKRTVNDRLYVSDNYFVSGKKVKACKCSGCQILNSDIDFYDTIHSEPNSGYTNTPSADRRFIVDTDWGVWSRWSDCSVSCGRGIAYRGRSCLKDTCSGQHVDVIICGASIECKDEDHWKEWTLWTQCSETSGLGIKKRTRGCSLQDQSCEGPFDEVTDCCVSNCPGEGSWASWETWSPCSGTCGHGIIQSRNRICLPSLLSGSLPPLCPGEKHAAKTCPYVPCVNPVHWQSWSDWSECACQQCPCIGQRYRIRKCSLEHACNGIGVQSDQCLKQCQKDGGWTSWTSWSSCGTSCGVGHIAQLRFCSNPEPKFGGKNCTGNNIRTALCNNNDPCPVDGNWANWQEWYLCSRTCGAGTQFRIRTCTSPQPSNGGKACPGSFDEVRQCQQQSCTVDGQWGDWNGWTYCSATCGPGTKLRSRACNNPKPQSGGQFCTPTNTYMENVTCNEKPCLASWSDWTAWGKCSSNCGAGIQIRSRVCGNGHDSCLGAYVEQRSCFDHSCQVNGNWADWEAWGSCSASCRNGTKTRVRTCTNPAPRNGGTLCQGRATETVVCMEASTCPVDGQWTNWLPWSRCTTTCGDGFKTRNRACINPVPQQMGRYCTGNDTETLTCSLPRCAGSTNFSCHVCENGLDPSYCDRVYVARQCPQHFCINEVTNYQDGGRVINRRCGTRVECDRSWMPGTNNDKCMQMDSQQVINRDIHCLFCCVDSLCNSQIVPTMQSLYIH